MSLRSWWQRWWPRHRWLVYDRPQVDDGHSTAFDPASDPLRFGLRQEMNYGMHGRLGDKDVPADELDLK